MNLIEQYFHCMIENAYLVKVDVLHRKKKSQYDEKLMKSAKIKHWPYMSANKNLGNLNICWIDQHIGKENTHWNCPMVAGQYFTSIKHAREYYIIIIARKRRKCWNNYPQIYYYIWSYKIYKNIKRTTEFWALSSMRFIKNRHATEA